MPPRPNFAVRADATLRRLGRTALFGWRALRDDRVETLGFRMEIPRGVPHPLLDGGTAFLARTVGPMLAPGHRVLVLDSGAGLLALVCASRGATVWAVDASPPARQATGRNAHAAGVGEAVRASAEAPAPGTADAFDLVLWDPGRRPHPAAIRDVAGALPRWIGESGRLLVRAEAAGGTAALIGCALPNGYRSVALARTLGLLPRREVLCVGWDSQAARRARHEASWERPPEQKAEKARRRWRGTAHEAHVAAP